jgi:Holliday junction resolvase
MPNRRYQKGYRKENKVVNQLKSLGYVAFRSAGSHSPIDVIGIHPVTKKCILIQCKSDNMSKTQKAKLSEANIGLNGMFQTRFIVI